MNNTLIQHDSCCSKETISLFFQILYSKTPPDAFLNICTKSKDRPGLLTRTFLPNDFNAVAQYVEKCKLHCDVYFEVCLQGSPPESGKRGKASGVKSAPGLWLDLDIKGSNHKETEHPETWEDALIFVNSLNWSPSVTICSGAGLHLYFLFEEPFVISSDEERTQISNLSRNFHNHVIMKGRERGWKFDNTGDISRLLRVPETLNHKRSLPQDVFIIEHDESARFSLHDFDCVTSAAESPSKATEVRLPATIQGTVGDVDSPASTTSASVYPDAEIDLIEEHCAWMAHCRYNATSLPEPEWYAAISIWGRCIDGESVAHDRSKAYPGYSHEETSLKIAHALQAGPRTCANIASTFCNSCPFHGKVTSPITLGNPQPLAQAKFRVTKTLLSVTADPKKAFGDEFLASMLILEKIAHGDFHVTLAALKKAGISKGEIRSALAAFAARANLTLDDVQNYQVINNCTFLNKATAFGMTPVLLANFVAKIVEEVEKDDGSNDLQRFYRIVAITQTGGHLQSVILSVQEFEAMTWVGLQWGAQVFIAAGQFCKDHMRVAIQVFSSDVVKRQVFSHTGWRMIENQWVYLTQAGGICADGFLDGVEVDLGKGLEHYSIPLPTCKSTICELILAALQFLKLAPNRITFPLFAAIFRALLGEVLAISFSTFIVGFTGTRKSELAAICQGFFGQNFSGKRLPGNWSSTPNALEKMAFMTKDAIITIDDYLNGETRNEAAQMVAKADRLVRGQGNQAGRQRMTSDAGLRGTYFPRGSILATGEEVPKGQSLQARMLILELEPHDVNLNVLTTMQKLSSEGILAAMIFFFIKWLAPQIDHLKESLPARKRELRQKAVEAEKAHTRTPDIIADLMIGLEMFTSFALEKGAILEAESNQFLKDGWLSLLEAAKSQEGQQKEQDPVERFRDMLNSALVAGRAHIANVDGLAPVSNPEAWGWKRFEGEMDTPGAPTTVYRSQGACIGWVDGPNVYLSPDAAHGAAQREAILQGTILITGKTLRKRLAERGLVASKGTETTTIRKTISGVRQKALHLNASFFQGDSGLAQSSGIPVFQPQENPFSQETQVLNPNIPSPGVSMPTIGADDSAFKMFFSKN